MTGAFNKYEENYGKTISASNSSLQQCNVSYISNAPASGNDICIII